MSQRIKLNKRLSHFSISQVYQNAADRLGITVADDEVFDCTKITVSKEIQEEIFQYYKEHNYDAENIGMLWVCVGPKTDDNLGEYEMEVSDGWIVKEEHHE